MMQFWLGGRSDECSALNEISMISLADFFTVPPDGSTSRVVRDREQTAGRITICGTDTPPVEGHRQGHQLSVEGEAYCPPTGRLARPSSLWARQLPRRHLRRSFRGEPRYREALGTPDAAPGLPPDAGMLPWLSARGASSVGAIVTGTRS
jgi:hypothetical protein